MQKLFTILLGVALSVSACAQSDNTPTGLKVGDTAPVFVAKDQNNNTFDLKKSLKDGPVVLVFYRGQWCPFCNKHISQLQDSLDLLKAKGATLIAVSPELPENLVKTADKTKASFPLLYDEGLKIMDAYKVTFAVEPNTVDRYKKVGIDLVKNNGENGTNLPVPATYVIGKDGKIKYVYFDPNYKNRPSVTAIMEHLK